MSDGYPSTPSHLRLVPAVTAEDLEAAARAEHPSNQAALDEAVYQWRGAIEHERSETPCCHQSIEVTNLVGGEHFVARDVVAMLSTVLHGWDGYDVMVNVTITPPRHRQ